MKAALVLAAAGALLAAPLVAAPANAAPAGEESVHVVKAGETLNGIANRAGVSPASIARANKLKEPWTLRAGQKLAIPRDAKAPVKVAAAKPATKPSDPAARSAGKAGRTAARVIAARGPAGNPETETRHTVLTGETLGGIAARAKVPRVLIAEANGLQPPYDVRVGQTLRIPRTRHHTVKSGDTGFSIAMDYGVAWDQIALANSLDPAAPVKPGQNLLIPTLLDPPPSGASKIDPAPKAAPPVPAARKSARFAWPLAGPTRRGYATGSDYHDGLDITAPKGTMVRAAAAGTVLFAGDEKEQFGNLVVVDHGDGWHTAYAFLSRVTVKEGAKVAAGERVGLVGDTGRAKGNELHFEVRRDGKPVDPLDQLPKAP